MAAAGLALYSLASSYDFRDRPLSTHCGHLFDDSRGAFLIHSGETAPHVLKLFERVAAPVPYFPHHSNGIERAVERLVGSGALTADVPLGSYSRSR